MPSGIFAAGPDVEKLTFCPRLWADLGPTLGDFVPTLARLWATLGRLWANFGSILDQLWTDFGLIAGSGPPSKQRLWDVVHAHNNEGKGGFWMQGQADS